MRPVYVVAVVAVTVAGLVLRRRRSLAVRHDRPLARGWRALLGGLGDTGLVAEREVHERLRGRVYRVVTMILFAVVAAAIVIPAVRSSSHTVSRVGLLGTVSGAERSTVLAAARGARIHVELSDEKSLATSRAALRAGRVTVVVENGTRLLVVTPVATGTTSSADQLASAVASALGFVRAVRQAGLTPAQATAVAHTRPVPIHSLNPAPRSGTVTATSVIGLILTFIMLTQYLTWTLMGVVEEKTTRVVEVLLATVRPVQLLGGKVLGIGIAALMQAGAVLAFALVLADAVGSDLLKGTAPSAMAASFFWLVVGYAFYSWVYAAAGSLVTRQDQVQSLALPLSVPLIFGYIVALTSSAGAPSVLVKVLAFLPPTAPFCMPLLVAKGATAWWAFLAAALVSVACTVVVARLAANVYRRAVLRTARRPSLRGLFAAHR